MVWKTFLTHTVSTGESPFRLLYGRDPQLPTELMLDPPVQRETVSLDDYQTVMCQQSLRKAQRKQKVITTVELRKQVLGWGVECSSILPDFEVWTRTQVGKPLQGTVSCDRHL